MKINKSKRLSRSRSGDIVISTILIVFAMYSLLPMVLLVNQAFKPLNELFLYPPRFFVQNPTFNNYRALFDLMSTTWVPFSRYLFNTAFITLAGTVGHIMVASMCAYPLAKLKVPGEKFIFTIIVFSLMFHATVSDIANYTTMAFLGFIDSYNAIIIPALATSLGLYLMKQFISQIPDSLIEAARIDGASEYKTFYSIIMPNVKPAWLTLAVFSFQALWSGTHTTYIYREELKSLPYAISQIVAGGIIRAGPAAAVGVVMMIVPVTFFIFTQKQIISTMSSSGMKE